MDKNILNQNEKNEITNDVKNAFKQAKYKSNGSINKKTLILSTVIIVIIFTGCIYFFLNNNPKNIFINNVNFVYKSAIKNISDDNVTSLNINYDSNKILYTKDNKKAVVHITNNNKTLYIKHNKIYLKEANQLYFIGEDKYHLSSSNTEILTCLKSFKNDFIKTMKDKKVYGSKSNTVINGKNMNVYMVSLNIDDNFKESLKNELISDNTFVNAYSKVNNITKDAAKSSIQTNIMNIPNKITIYTSPLYHDMLKIEFDNLEITKISKDNYNIKNNNNLLNIKLGSTIVVTTSEHRIEIKNGNSKKITYYNTENAKNINYNLIDFFN